MTFTKGTSGNPRGRPPAGRSVAEHIRLRAGNNAQVYVDLLHSMALNRRIAPKVRAEVVRILLDRGWGKPTTDINVNTGNNVDLTGVDLDRLTDDQLEELHALSTRTAAILAEVRADQQVH